MHISNQDVRSNYCHASLFKTYISEKRYCHPCCAPPLVFATASSYSLMNLRLRLRWYFSLLYTSEMHTCNNMHFRYDVICPNNIVSALCNNGYRIAWHGIAQFLLFSIIEKDE